MVAERIKRLIIDQRLGPGDRLPTEQALADRFGVSRISVREATKALSFLGIIEAAPRRGLVVGDVDMERVAQYLGFHLAIAHYPIEQLLETRIIVESGVLPVVIRRMAADGAVYERLNELVDHVRRARGLDERIAADIAFHRGLLDASGLQPLVVFNDLLQIFFERFRRSLATGDWKMGIRQHQRIIDAMRDGDLPMARELLQQHLDMHRGFVGEG